MCQAPVPQDFVLLKKEHTCEEGFVGHALFVHTLDMRRFSLNMQFFFVWPLDRGILRPQFTKISQRSYGSVVDITQVCSIHIWELLFQSSSFFHVILKSQIQFSQRGIFFLLKYGFYSFSWAIAKITE